LKNTPDNLTQPIHAARAINPQTANELDQCVGADARDMAAYLYTLD